MNTPLLKSRHWLSSASLLALMASLASHAQTAPQQTETKTAAPAPSTESDAAASPDEEPVIELSPFIINEEKDSEGFRATSTLAGNRLRTELKDLGGATSVVTREFLTAIGATSNESLLTYTTSTEIGGPTGNFGGVGNGRELNESNSLLRPNSATRVRGLTSADNTRDLFLTDIPWDGYNISRVELQRGPNAILFGIGSPAGIINNSLSQAVFKNETKVEARFDQEGSLRGTLDVNQVLVPKELAIRFASMAEHVKYRQDPAFSRDKRLFGTLRYDPAFLKKNGMSTTLRANYEIGEGRSNRPRNLTPTDNMSAWWTQLNKATYQPGPGAGQAWNGQTGERQFNVSGGTNNGQPNLNYNPWVADYGNIFGNMVSVFNAGSTTQAALRGLEKNTYWGINTTGGRDGGFFDGGFARQVGVANYSGWAGGVRSPSNPLVQGLNEAQIGAFRDRAISDPGIFDFYNKLLDGDNKREWRELEAQNVSLAQTFFDNRLGVQGDLDKQHYVDGQTYGVRNTLYMDINSVGLDGVANPNVGQAFVQHNNGGQDFDSRRETKRLTAFGELRGTDFLDRGWLASIIGTHRVTGALATEERWQKKRDFLEYVFDESFVRQVGFGDADQPRGQDEDAYKLSNRSPVIVSYLSGNLSGVGSANQANLQNVSARRIPTPQNGRVYRYDSHWVRPTDPSAAGYVNPAAPWSNPDQVPGDPPNDTQSNNPANYGLWGNYPISPIVSWESGANLYTNGTVDYFRDKSKVFIWQAYLFDGVLVPTIGWRKDKYIGGSARAPGAETYGIIQEMNWDINKEKLVEYSSEWVRSTNVVLHTPARIKAKMPLETSLSLFYAESENFQPKPGDIDMFGAALPNPSGETKEKGFVLSTLNDRINLKVNWFETKIQNDRVTGFEFWRIAQTASTLLMSASRVRNKDAANDWMWNYSSWTGNGGQARADLGAQTVLDTYNTNPVFKGFIDSWNMTQYLNQPVGNQGNNTSATPLGTTGTSDTVSKGLEFELFAKPIKGWDVAVNASKVTAVQNNVGGSLLQWLNVMDPLLQGPAGDLRQWWAGDSNTMRMRWNSEVMSQFNRIKAQEGTALPEIRKWRFNLVNSYNFSNGFLKGTNVGVGYRWEDKVAIGYPVMTRANALTGVPEQVYDVARPYYGPREDHVDLWVGYGRKLTRKIDWRIQLNVRDVLAKKELIKISVQPDGSPAAYRIPELRSWAITNTLTF